jgi:hypothetical protein
MTVSTSPRTIFARSAGERLRAAASWVASVSLKAIHLTSARVGSRAGCKSTSRAPGSLSLPRGAGHRSKMTGGQGQSSMGFVPENQVRTRLPAGWNRIRTIGPALAKGSSGRCQSETAARKAEPLQVQVRNGNACLEWLPIAFPFTEGRHLRDREGTGTLREGPKVRISLAQSRLKMVGKVGLSAFASRGPARIIPPRARRADRASARPAA